MKRSTPMKRGKPLARKTPIKAAAPMKRSAKPIARKKRIDPMSKRPRAVERRNARARCCRIVKARDKVCQAPIRYATAGIADPLDHCWGPLDVHEILPRGRGGDETDPANCVLVCRNHHDHAHHIDQESATAAGLLAHSWDFFHPLI